MKPLQIDRDELAARKLALEQRIKGYQESVTTLAGPCSRSSIGKALEECEMELEQVRSELGEI